MLKAAGHGSVCVCARARVPVCRRGLQAGLARLLGPGTGPQEPLGTRPGPGQVCQASRPASLPCTGLFILQGRAAGLWEPGVGAGREDQVSRPASLPLCLQCSAPSHAAMGCMRRTQEVGPGSGGPCANNGKHRWGN